MKDYEKQKLVMAIYGAKQHLNILVKLDVAQGVLSESIIKMYELNKELQKELKEKQND